MKGCLSQLLAGCGPVCLLLIGAVSYGVYALWA